MGNPIVGKLQILLKKVNYKLDGLEQIDSDELKNVVLEYDNKKSLFLEILIII